MIIKKEKYLEMKNEIDNLKTEMKELKDDSGEAVIKRITKLAKIAKLDVYSKEYQDIMHRLFMDIAGRHSSVMKGYSQTSFVKDNDEEVLKRLEDFRKEASIITKQLKQDKKRK